MKTPSSRNTRGFTLVELLVVIAIIAVLASAGFAGAKFAIEKAKRAAALTAATAIEAAVNNFFTEYGYLPTIEVSQGEMDATALNTKDDLEFLEVLLGLEDPNSSKILNTRGIKFLTVPEGKRKGQRGGIDGLVYSVNGKVIQGLFDPWGGAYYVQMDTGFDEKVTVGTADSRVKKTLNKIVAVWSNGADNLTGSPGKGKMIDDVKTWK